MIVILGKDKDFSHTLAEQVVRELGESCECIAEPQEFKRLASQEISLVVTAENSAPEGYAALCLHPPIRLAQALGDIAEALRPPEGSAATAIAGGFLLAERNKQLTHTASGASVMLTDKETQLLKAIAGASGGGIGKEQLLKDVWGIGADLNTHTLETHIYRLRAKLKELCGAEMIAATDNGYRLTL